MIVVDTNIISYLFLPTTYTELAEQLYQRDANWIAPPLWRSEFRNVLALYLRKDLIGFEDALALQEQAELLLAETEMEASSSKILELVNTSQCSAYDCEFVALAKDLNLRLVTQDKKMLAQFPETAKSLQQVLGV
ncbi:MAG: type II toxin-antitoxin system VapC family toxin [Thiolinea sp.]